MSNVKIFRLINKTATYKNPLGLASQIGRTLAYHRWGSWFKSKHHMKSDVVVHVCNPRTWEVETGVSEGHYHP